MDFVEQIDEILCILYGRNKRAINAGGEAVRLISCSPEYSCFEETLGFFFPCELEVCIPNLFIPVNLCYSKESTQELASSLLNMGAARPAACRL